MGAYLHARGYADVITATAQFDPVQLAALQRRMAAMRELTGRSQRAVVFATTKEFLFAAIKATPVAETVIPRHGVDSRGKAGVWALIRRGHGKTNVTYAAPRIGKSGKPLKPRGRQKVLGVSGVDEKARMTLVSWPMAQKWGLRRQNKAGRPFDWTNEFGKTFAQWKGVGLEKNYGKGFARAGWIAALHMLGINRFRASTMAAQFARVVNMLNAMTVRMEVANQVPYIVQLDQGSAKRAPANILDNAMAATVRKLDENMARIRARMESAWTGGQATVNNVG